MGSCDYVISSFHCIPWPTFHVAALGNLDGRKWAAETKEKQYEFWKYYEQGSRIQENDAAINNNQGIVLILDFDGYTLKHFASDEVIHY